MKLNVKIENLGKLSHADIQIRNFTVFAGPNNTGKAYVSKMLYSILNVMRTEHWGEMPNKRVFRAEQSLKRFVRYLPDTVEGKEEFVDEARNHLKKMYTLFRVANEKSFDQKLKRMNATLEERKETANKILSLFKEFKDKLPAEESKEPSARDSRFWRLRLELSLEDLSRTASENAEQLVSGELSEDFSRNLRGNFAIEDESSLRYSGKETATISCEDLGTFSIDESGGTVECPVENIKKFQEFPKLIYLESPIYWKMKDALEASRFRERRALGVPQYFYDLMAELRETKGEDSRPISHFHELHGQVSEVVAQRPFISNENPRQIDLFHELHEDITETIGGKLVVSDESELLFQENGREYPLSVAAMGVVNYGMLGLLIERGIIDETTFLFMDEPEAHLHPEWQVKIARTLFELAKLGTRVIIATHSVDILEWLAVEIKENPASEKIIALNHFSTKGKTMDHEGDLARKQSAIIVELTEPFYDLYMRDL